MAHRFKILASGMCCALLCNGCAENRDVMAAIPVAAIPSTSVTAPLLVDFTQESGIDFRHLHGGVGNREAPETMGGGLGLLDFDRDGDLDIYFVQSGPIRLPGRTESRAGAENALHSNRGGARFDRIPDAAGAADSSFGMGCAVGDIDGDGWDDLLVLNWGPNALFANRKGRFRDVTEITGLGNWDQWSVSAAFFDSDGDGDLDLYIVNYIVSPPGSYLNQGLNPRAPLGFRLYPTPDGFSAERDRFLVNRGNERGAELARFEDQTAISGLDKLTGKGLGVVVTDIDLDGHSDLYIANDGTPNGLFHNLGHNRFQSRGRELGTAFNNDGLSEAGMGVDAGDVDGDGQFDLVVTNLDNETNSLYLNRGPERLGFRDRTRTSGLAEPSRSLLGFGALLEDFDLDGDLDFFVCNGHVIDNVRLAHAERTHAQPNQLFLRESGRFREASAALLGPGVAIPFVSRGSAVGDLDGDGFFDIAISNNRGPAQILLARPTASNWIRIELEGPPGNPHGLGATVWLQYTDGSRSLRRVESARSYASASEPAIVAGLIKPLSALEIQWPGGQRERFKLDPSAMNSTLRLSFGHGQQD